MALETTMPMSSRMPSAEGADRRKGHGEQNHHGYAKRAEEDDQDQEHQNQRHDYREEEVPEALVDVLVLATHLRLDVAGQRHVGEGTLRVRRDGLGVGGGDLGRYRESPLPVDAADGRRRVHLADLG